ncbi:MAG: polysaccharide biosynthesis protein [Clostridia bacterium]|nr:polysaccharide biosynthesis protein [Clostridia bacterium]
MLDRFFLTFFADKIELTFYHISQVLSNSVVQVTSSVILVSIPRLSFLWGNEKKDEYYDLLQKSSAVFSILSFPCCLGMAFLSTEIIYLYSGEKYLSGSVVLFAFCIRYLIGNFDSIFAKQVLLPTNNEKSLTKIYYIGGFYNIVLKIILLLAGKLSALSCIISTATADILVIILQIFEIKKYKIKNVVFSKDLIIPFVISAFFSVIIFIIHQFLIPENIKNVTLISLFSVIICSSLYFIALLLTKNRILLSLLRSKK